MQRLRLMVIGALLLVVAGAVAQSPDGPPEYIGLKETTCWPCHSPGNWDPDMDPLAIVVAEPASLVPGETMDLEIRIYNSWIVAERNFELSGFVATLDATNAPALRFVSDKGAETMRPIQGTIPFDPVAQATNPESILESGAYLVREHSGYVTVDVPQGATELLIQVTPDDASLPMDQDFALNVYPGSEEPSGTPAIEVDATGPGEPEAVHVDGAAAFGAYGYGSWVVEVVATINDPETPSASYGDVPFTVEMTSWFDAGDASISVATADRVVRSGQDLAVSWPVAVVEAWSDTDTLTGILNVTGHYDHPGAEPDWDDFMLPFTLDVTATPDGGTLGLDGVAVAFEEPPLVSLAEISEVIGYIAGALIVVSMWTGGLFGRRSRQRQNRMFGSAKRRVAFHNFLSYGIIVAAIVHLIVFLVEINYHWLLGMLWGGLSILALLLLGVTGALQVPIIRRWNYAAWKWTHFGLAIGSLLFAVVHILLDGTHFGNLQESIGWVDPLVPDDRQ